MSDIQRAQLQEREFLFDIASRASDDAIPVVVSTDAVVEVADGPEVLVHSAEAVDLRRAPLPIIATHAGGQVNVGVVEDIQITGGQLRGMARFGARQEAAEYKRDVLDRIIRSVSVGYARIKAKVRADGVLVTTRWMPTHAALVAEPADTGAGFYRAAAALPEFEIEPTDPAEQAEAIAAPAIQERAAQVSPTAAPAAPERKTMTVETQAAAGVNADNGGAIPAQPRQGPGAMELEKSRQRAIANLCEANKIGESIRDHWIGTGASIDMVSDELLAIVRQRGEQNRKETPSALGLTEKEAQRFSIFKAALAVHENNWTNAGFELECTRAIAKRLGKDVPDPKRFYVPYEVQERSVSFLPGQSLAVGQYRNHHVGVQQRDLTVGAPSAGGYNVGTSNVSFIDLLRNRAVAFRMGATPMPGMRENVTMPRQTATGTATWLANEASAISEVNQTFGQLALTPKTVGAYTEVSRLLMMQSNPSIEGIVTSDLATVTALAVDTAVLSGSGSSGQPTGIINTAGIGSVTGTSLAFDDILEFQTDVAGANVMPVRGGYVTTHAVASLCIQRVKYASTASPLWEGNVWDGSMQGFPAMGTNQMSSATMLFGDWSQVLVPEWGVLEIEVNPYANFTAAIVGIRAIYTVDCGLRYAGAFSYASSIT